MPADRLDAIYGSLRNIRGHLSSRSRGEISPSPGESGSSGHEDCDCDLRPALRAVLKYSRLNGNSKFLVIDLPYF